MIFQLRVYFFSSCDTNVCSCWWEHVFFFFSFVHMLPLFFLCPYSDIMDVTRSILSPFSCFFLNCWWELFEISSAHVGFKDFLFICILERQGCADVFFSIVTLHVNSTLFSFCDWIICLLHTFYRRRLMFAYPDSELGLPSCYKLAVRL